MVSNVDPHCCKCLHPKQKFFFKGIHTFQQLPRRTEASCFEFPTLQTNAVEMDTILVYIVVWLTWCWWHRLLYAVLCLFAYIHVSNHCYQAKNVRARVQHWWWGKPCNFNSIWKSCRCKRVKVFILAAGYSFGSASRPVGHGSATKAETNSIRYDCIRIQKSLFD